MQFESAPGGKDFNFRKIESFDAPELYPYASLRRSREHEQKGIFVAEGTKVVNASNVGLARASLQKKDYANATSFAALPNQPPVLDCQVLGLWNEIRTSTF